MVIMIVCASEERQQQLTAAIPLGDNDLLLWASGLLSAIWYGKACHPDRVFVDPWPPDDCSAYLVDALKSLCPDTRLLFNPHHPATPA